MALYAPQTAAGYVVIAYMNGSVAKQIPWVFG